MFGYLDFLFLSYSGRIGRSTYWVAYFVLAAIEMVIVWWLVSLSHGTFEQLVGLDKQQLRALSPQIFKDVLMHVLLPVGIVSLLFLYPTYALATKRWHDRGKSGWWSLIGFVPLIGALWMFIELGFLGGQDGTNEYGYR
jgi:uncharacterized membrane protein YhaH (DUF805 family)